MDKWVGSLVGCIICLSVQVLYTTTLRYQVANSTRQEERKDISFINT